MSGPPQNLTRSSQMTCCCLQDLGTTTSQEHPRRAFTQTPLIHGICKIIMQGPLGEDLTRMATRSSDRTSTISCKDLSGRTASRSPQDLPIKTCARSHKDLLEDVSRIFTSSSHTNLHKIMQGLLTGFHPDLRDICSHAPPQGLGQGLTYYGPLGVARSS